MSSQISAEKLSLLIGTANTPLIDARVDEDFSADSRILEGGHVAWKEAQLATVPADEIPKRDNQGRWCRRGIDGHACRDTNARSGLALVTPPHGPNERR